MSQVLSLYRLQQIDSQIDRIKTRLQAILKTLEDDAELKQAREELRLAEEKHASAEGDLKIAETEARNIHIKIEQVDASLYGGASHSPKELQDLQNDLAALKRRRVTLEDSQLEAMIAVENAEAAARGGQEKLQAILDRLAEQNRGLNQEQEALFKEVEKLTTERDATTGAIPADAIALYDQLRQQKRGLAIATISDNSCDACGSNLSLAQIQSARSSNQMAQCPSCGRILYGS